MSNLTPQDRLKALDLRTKRALVVDDNVHSRKLLIELLRSFELVQISTSPSPADALATLRAARYDFVFCNWNQPPMDSAAFALCVRASDDPRFREVPIIILKAAAKLNEVIAARDAGITEFLAIPLSANALLQVLESAIVRKRKFVEAANFRGPDRRRRRDGDAAAGRRETDSEDPTSRS